MFQSRNRKRITWRIVPRSSQYWLQLCYTCHASGLCSESSRAWPTGHMTWASQGRLTEAEFFWDDSGEPHDTGLPGKATRSLRIGCTKNPYGLERPMNKKRKTCGNQLPVFPFTTEEFGNFPSSAPRGALLNATVPKVPT